MFFLNDGYTFDVVSDMLRDALRPDRMLAVASSRSSAWSDVHQLEPNVERKDDELRISFFVPGVKANDINLEVQGRNLTIEYKFSNLDVRKSYNIDAKYDASRAAANLENGVLDVRVPVSEVAKSKKITINVK